MFSRHIKGKGSIGIFSEVTESDYHKIEILMISMFSHQNNFKFVKCRKRATEIEKEKEEDLHKQISLYHNNESTRCRINKTYNILKQNILS